MASEYKNVVEFGGMDTNSPADKISDRNCSYSNAIDFSSPGLIKSAGSSSVTLGQTATGDSGPATGDAFVFRKAFGTDKEIAIRVYRDGSRYLQWFNDNASLNDGKGQWENLFPTGFNSTNRWGFAAANGDGGQAINRLVMGNAQDYMMTWSGATTRLVSVTSSTIVCNTSLSDEGFTLNPYGVANTILINGQSFTYTGISSQTFTGVTPNPVTSWDAGDIKSGDGVTQSAENRLMREELYTSETIAFNYVGLSGNTITDTNATFLSSDFQLGQRITVTGSSVASNNATYTIKARTNTTIYLDDGQLVTSAGTGDRVTISAGAPKGNILAVTQGKLWVAGVSGNESKYYYSKTGDVTDFAISSGLGSGGSVTLTEGGGAITALVAGNENTLIVHKNNAIISYKRELNTVGSVVETIKTLVSGYGVGAINNNCVPYYGKQYYFLNGNGEIKVMRQSIYSDALFEFDDIADDIKNFMSEAVSKRGGQYMIYNPYYKCLVVTTAALASDGNLCNCFVYVFINKTPSGYVYNSSIEKLSSPAHPFIQDMPLIFFNSTNRKNAMVVYFPYQRNSYIWLGGNPASSRSGRAIFMTKEYTFGDATRHKQFDIMNVSGYLYGDTELKISVIYGPYGQAGSKLYTIDKDFTFVNADPVSSVSADIVGEFGYPSLEYNTMISQSRYFNLPLHIDCLKSDRYKIVFETYGEVNNSFWAISHFATNPVLKEIDYDKLFNQNDPSNRGVGSENTGFIIS